MKFGFLKYYLGKVSNITTFKKGMLISVKNKKMPSILYSTDYDSKNVAIKAKKYSKNHKKEINGIEPNSKAILKIINIIDNATYKDCYLVGSSSMFLVVEDEYSQLNPFLFRYHFNPYDNRCRRVKILTEYGTYWADPREFVRARKRY